MVQHEINLPEGWVLKQIKDVAPLQRGFDLPASKVVSGKYPVCYSNGIANYHNEFKAEGPGVFTGRSGTIGNVFYVKENYWPHNTSLWVTDFKGNDRKFVYYLYQQVKLDRFNAGTGVPTLNRNDVHVHKIPIPKSAVEQQKIASILSTWDKAIELKEKLIEQKKEQKKGLMQKLLTGEVRLPGFHGNWVEMSMENCIDIMNGFPFKSELFNGEKIGMPLIRVRDIKAKQITTYYSGEYSNNYIIREGDVIVGMDGEFNITMWDKTEGLLNQRVMKIIPKSGYDLYFIYQLLRPKLKKIEELTSSTTVKHLSNKDVNRLKVKTPSYDEQKAIGKVLLNADKEIALLESEIEYLYRQKQGLMQLLLTGKVRVKV